MAYSFNDYSKFAVDALAREGSSTEGINNIQDLMRRYGMTGGGVKEQYGYARRNLGTQRAGALSSLSGRLGNRYANPEAAFAPVEGQFALASGQLEGQAAQAQTEEQQFLAQLLNNIIQNRDQFKLQRIGLQGNLANAGRAADFGESQAPGTLDDILAAIGVGAKAYSGLR